MTEVDPIWQASSTTHTHAYLNEAAKLALARAVDLPHDELYYSMTAILLSAFSLEAFLNHMGQELLPTWPTFERSRPSLQTKLSKVAGHLRLTIDFDARPFSALDPLFRFRNFLVHGRTETLSARVPPPNLRHDRVQFPWPAWMHESNPDTARRYLTDVEEIAQVIHEAAGHKSRAFSTLRHGGATPVAAE